MKEKDIKIHISINLYLLWIYIYHFITSINYVSYIFNCKFEKDIFINNIINKFYLIIKIE